MSARRIILTLFTSRTCSICNEAKLSLDRVRKKIPFDLEQKDIYEPDNRQWLEQYKYDIPVLHMNNQFLFQHWIKEDKLENVLRKYRETGIIEQS
ncbi:7242_t:CDS:2 [Ambispora gerdemannii]|uniref:Glutaredoxin-like protein n=1 Tax=Ambispora gerdemannii TaxID=144530 RepID=A0A9N8VJZ1_9GLOM|nr:7242_t:CDS:2 [Ambispora gerdemannii]